MSKAKNSYSESHPNQDRDELALLQSICQGMQVTQSDQWVVTLHPKQLLPLAESLKNHVDIQAECLLD